MGQAVQSDASVDGPDGRQVLLDAACGLETARADQPGGVEAEVVSVDGEGPDVGHAAVGLEGLVLRGEGLLGGVGPCIEGEPTRLVLQVFHGTLKRNRQFKI